MIKLSDVVDNMECLDDEDRCYFHIPTQTFYSPIVEHLRIAEECDQDDNLSRYSEWERKSIIDTMNFLEHEDEYIVLPNKFDINEYQIMEEFCEQIENPRIREHLFNTINGRGAFRRFKDTIIDYNIENKWYQFREQAYQKIAIEWCKENNIEYTYGVR